MRERQRAAQAAAAAADEAAEMAAQVGDCTDTWGAVIKQRLQV
jgi:hypothetical protein